MVASDNSIWPFLVIRLLITGGVPCTSPSSRALRARLGTLRNPTRLTQLAAAQKLARPKRVIEIPALGGEIAQR